MPVNGPARTNELGEPPDHFAALRADILALATLATAALEGVSARLDAINVWPVADQDTGRNLTRTLRAITENAAATTDSTAGGVVDDLERALRGARGNSGTILAAMIGAATRSVLTSPRVDGPGVAAAVRAAALAAYEAVPRPVEGTMLTVARAMAEASEASARSGSGPLAVLMDALVAGERATGATRVQHPVLRHFDVIDAGAAGLVEIVRAVLAAYGTAPESREPPQQPRVVPGSDHVPDHRFCVSLYVASSAPRATIEDGLARMGDSIVVAQDRRGAKVHLHTEAPDGVKAFAAGLGSIEFLEVTDMYRQVRSTTAE